MAPEPPTPALAELGLLEIAPAEPPLGNPLAARISRRLRLPCRLEPVPDTLALVDLPGRNQVDADRLLAAVEALPARPACTRIAVTGRDIGHPIFTHFFGRARRGGNAVVVSTARLDPTFYGLDPDPERLLERALREVLHELGHASGLGHCGDWACVMHFAANVGDLDNRGGSYCPGCASRLPGALALPSQGSPTS